MRPLGSTQKDVLAALIEHKGWQRHCGWHWSGVSNTERVLESLVRRGMVQKKLVTSPFGTCFRYTAVRS